MTDERLRPALDEWSDWLLHKRQGGDPVHAQHVRDEVDAFVRRVVDGARLEAGMRLLDVGAGDGVVSFCAIDKIGRSLKVVVSDISPQLLAHAESEAHRLGVEQQCEFVLQTATDLNGVADSSIDVVAMRSVLAYVGDKSAALHEFLRVLKPGGRLSIGEPIMRDEALELIHSFAWVKEQAVDIQSSILPLLLRWRAAQFPSTVEEMQANPLTNFSDRDLVHLASASGFKEVHMEMHIDVQPAPAVRWSTFLACAPHPWSPTAGTILTERFTAEERVLLEAAMRPVIESGPRAMLTRMAYLTARKPSA